jgi:hypothetical protein
MIIEDVGPDEASGWSARPLESVITRAWDHLLRDTQRRRETPTGLTCNLSIPESYPALPPALNVPGLALSAPQARLLHGVTRAATPLEREGFESQMYLGASTLSGAVISDLLKLLSGRKPRRPSDQAERERARLRSIWKELEALLDRVKHLAPPSHLARDGKRVLIEALKSARACLSVRVKVPPNPPAPASCAAANATLANEIMRHGPPLAACPTHDSLGAS